MRNIVLMPVQSSVPLHDTNLITSTTITNAHKNTMQHGPQIKPPYGSLPSSIQNSILTSEDIQNSMTTSDVTQNSISSSDVVSQYHPTTIRVGSIYQSKLDLCYHLKMYAINNNFQYMTITSSKTCLHVACLDENCSWTVRVVRVGAELFEIRRFDPCHTCPVDFHVGDHRQATSDLVANLVQHRYLDASKKPYAPSEIRDDMRRDFGISISYKKALAVKHMALSKLYGTDHESYQLLPSLCYVLREKNPGSSIELIRSRQERFKYMFLSLAAWKEAWDRCVPVLIVDGTFMKSYYKGIVLTACCQDANKQIVPVAFGFCESENKESWLWFFNKLKVTLTGRHNLYVVSDRHEGIIDVVAKVFPSASHGYCTEHIVRNIRSNFRGSEQDQKWKFRKAARAPTALKCERYLKLLDEEDPRIRGYLAEIGAEKWARYASGPVRYSVMTSNAAESMNNVNKSAREYPIAKLVDFIRERMQKWFHERFEIASSVTSILPKKLEADLVALKHDALRMKVKPSCAYEFEVIDLWSRSYIVNLNDKSCTCGDFQLDHFVCVHAIAAISSRPTLSCYSFISPFYRRTTLVDTYARIVHPIGDRPGWVVPDSIVSEVCLPPTCAKRPPGRPKKNRYPSKGEFQKPKGRRKQACSRCLNVGHNVKTCTNPIPIPHHN